MERHGWLVKTLVVVAGCFVVGSLTGCQQAVDSTSDSNGPPQVANRADGARADGAPAETTEPPSSEPVTHVAEKPPIASPGTATQKFSLDWQNPKLLLVFSGAQHGYLEPCGCAGLENMKGGLGRRHTLLRQLAKSGTPVVALDAGDLVKRSGPQSVIKYQRSIDSLLAMKYQAVGFGLSDLHLQPTDLVATVPADGRETPFVSANIGLFELGDDTISARFRVIQQGGMKIGVTTVLGDEATEELSNPDLEFLAAAEALQEVLPQLQAAKCDRLVLLVAGTIDEAEELAGSFPQFDFVVAAGESDPPPPDVEEIDGTDTRLIELSHKGMYVGVLGFFDDTTRPYRYQRVAIDSRFADSAEMKSMLAAYQDQLQAEGFDRLGVYFQPAPHDDKFVGSKTCQACHESEYETWSESGHAHAFATLSGAKPPRHFDPECLSCHVIGWEPQDYVPIDSGYASLEKTPHLLNVGCENCHGAGGSHVALEQKAENGDDVDEDLQDALYERMRVTVEQARNNTCIQCHDLDNSPDFEFDKYWPEIEH